MSWKKVPNQFAWEHTKTKNVVIVEGYGNTFEVSFDTSSGTKSLGLARTSVQALNMAKRWMKAHPKG